MTYRNSATSLRQGLNLQHPPIALAYVDQKPTDIEINLKRAPSSCAFWRTAEKGLFFAAAEDHMGCAVGAHVMGFPLLAETQKELSQAVQLMSQVNYLQESEVPHIPQVQKKASGVVYGPLDSFPLTADCALVWVTPAQAMVLGEALRTTAWDTTRNETQAMFGRPACGAIAHAISQQAEAVSLGCAGMRTFTEISPELAFIVIPGSALATLPERLSLAVASNQSMLDHYKEKLVACT
jgi:uncharacterized protein (DUF169 family)